MPTHRSDAARHGCASDRLHEGCVLVIDRVAPQAGSRGLCRKHTCHWWPGSKVRSHAQFAPGWRIPHISAWSCPTGCVQGCARSISIKSPRSGRPYTVEYHSIGLDFDTARDNHHQYLRQMDRREQQVGAGDTPVPNQPRDQRASRLAERETGAAHASHRARGVLSVLGCDHLCPRLVRVVLRKGEEPSCQRSMLTTRLFGEKSTCFPNA